MYKVSGLVVSARQWQVIRVFSEARFFPCIGVSSSFEMLVQIFQGFTVSLNVLLIPV